MAVNYTVGAPNGGWDQSTDLTAWASSQRFVPGDNLKYETTSPFMYTPNHDVREVTEADFDSCTTTNPLQPPHSGGFTFIPLTSAGSRYFICGTGGHCLSGMKLQINTNAASTPPPSTTPSLPPPPATTPPPSVPPPATPPSIPPPPPTTTPSVPSPPPTPSARRPVSSPPPKSMAPSPSPKHSPTPKVSPASPPPKAAASGPALPPASAPPPGDSLLTPPPAAPSSADKFNVMGGLAACSVLVMIMFLN
ncbi:hypothetical protein DH2020_031403 [Rehmannia glutinosa]|uniref:Phytocyanin domain-containing protein n=1 Tax=Rehmannia glutinosa TaxID=99300 RepID=A0ABR0VLJ0_REHGL